MRCALRTAPGTLRHPTFCAHPTVQGRSLCGSRSPTGQCLREPAPGFSVLTVCLSGHRPNSSFMESPANGPASRHCLEEVTRSRCESFKSVPKVSDGTIRAWGFRLGKCQGQIHFLQLQSIQVTCCTCPSLGGGQRGRARPACPRPGHGHIPQPVPLPRHPGDASADLATCVTFAVRVPLAELCQFYRPFQRTSFLFNQF